MEQEEYIVDGHRVTHSVHLGDREIFLAVQQDAPLPFYVGYMEVSYELGLARFSGIEGTTEYALNGMEAHLKKLTQEISEIEKQQENTRQELEKPFAQEQELAEKEARLSAVNALLNIDGKNSIPDLMDDTLDIEPPQRAAKDYER